MVQISKLVPPHNKRGRIRSPSVSSLSVHHGSLCLQILLIYLHKTGGKSLKVKDGLSAVGQIAVKSGGNCTYLRADVVIRDGEDVVD